MKTLKFANQEFKAEKIIKTDTDIVGKDINGIEVFRFNGISDFTGFVLEEGQTFDVIEPTQDDLLRAKLIKDNANIQLQLAQQQKLNADTLLKIAKVGGATNA